MLQLLASEHSAVLKLKAAHDSFERLHSFPRSVFAGFGEDLDQSAPKIRGGMTVAIKRRTRSIAVIGRKRSAQDSWDDARASSSFSGAFQLKRRFEKYQSLS